MKRYPKVYERKVRTHYRQMRNISEKRKKRIKRQMLTKPWKYIFNFWKKRSELCRRSKKYLENFFRKWLATNRLKNKDKKIKEYYYGPNVGFRDDISSQFKLYN